MRGKANDNVDPPERVRITPAYAGKRLSNSERISDFFGSPPPMRGKGSLAAPKVQRTGITPAYAGKSRLLEIVNVNHKDHPRLCGEKLCQKTQRSSTVGSPPPMRGKVCGKQ